jgi:hypothetical protein
MNPLPFIYYVLFISPIFIFSQSNHSLYGERDLVNKNVALYFDKEGSIYPDYFISNAALAATDASLSKWYAQHLKDFLSISKLYACAFKNYSLDNGQILNDSIAAFKRRKINASALNYNSVSILIHGFRKPFTAMNGDATSPADFQTMKSNLNSMAALNTCFVEVYWDAMYSCCFTANIKKNNFLFALFDTAQIYASAVGKGLRRIINHIEKDTINIITHSLGAKVAIYSLFNVDDFAIYDVAAYARLTPQNKRVNICLVAPAIGGEAFFKNYFKRQSFINFKNSDNYKLAIAYNEADFVLMKKDNKLGLLGPGPYGHGNTSLGCNYENTAVNLKTYFATHFPNSKIELFDVTLGVGKIHHVRDYFAGSNLVSALKYLRE